jgi:hypothetical protein
MSSCVDVMGCDIAQSFVVTPAVIVFDEGSDRFLQLAGHIVRHLVNFSFDGAMVSCNLAIGLRMESLLCLPPQQRVYQQCSDPYLL